MLDVLTRNRQFLGVLLMLFLGTLLLSAGKYEVGTLDTLNTFTTPTFTSISFTQSFDETPLVFAMPTNQGSDPSALRIKNVSTTGFDIAALEPPGNDGPHIAMTNIAYFAVEYGRTEISPGVFVDAGSLTTDTTVQSIVFGSTGGFDTVTYRSDYSSAPAVLGMIQTMNNELNPVPSTNSSPWLTTSINNIGTSTFDIALERSETDDGSSVSQTEVIGYLAFDSSTGSFTDDSSNTILWDSLISPDTVVGWSDGFTVENFNQTFTSAPLTVATKATRDGGDGGWLRRSTITTTGISLAVDEDIYNDPERNHTTERASIVAFSDAFTADLTTAPIEITWQGGGLNGNWTESADWSNQNWDRWNGEDVNLIDGDTIVFDNTGSAITTTTVVEDYTAELAGIRFDGSTAYTLNGGGGSLIFEDGASITNNSSQVQSLGVPMSARGSSLTIDAGSVSGGGFGVNANNTIDLSDTGGVELTLTGSNTMKIAGAISGSGGTLVKTGTGMAGFTGSDANTYTGTTTISGGTLILAKTSGVDSIAGDVIVNSGGTLMLGSDNQIKDTSKMTLSGGTFDTSGNDETLDTLTLSSSSSIEFGSGASVLSFADSSGTTWAASASLSVFEWSGSTSGGGTDQLIFGNASTALTTTQVDQIRFVNPAGFNPGTYFAKILSTGEVVPVVPEPSTLLAGLGVLFILLGHFYLRYRSKDSD